MLDFIEKKMFIWWWKGIFLCFVFKLETVTDAINVHTKITTGTDLIQKSSL